MKTTRMTIRRLMVATAAVALLIWSATAWPRCKCPAWSHHHRLAYILAGW